jgi:hypothetical protein
MIFVLKTSVKTRIQVKELKPHLDKMLPQATWNFDLKDRDKILRIVSDENIVHDTISLLNSHKYYCEELA